MQIDFDKLIGRKFSVHSQGYSTKNKPRIDFNQIKSFKVIDHHPESRLLRITGNVAIPRKGFIEDLDSGFVRKL